MTEAEIPVFEVLVEKHRITERRGSAIYSTEKLSEEWVHCGHPMYTELPGEIYYVALPTQRTQELGSKTLRRAVVS